jgi:hypothetical protein
MLHTINMTIELSLDDMKEYVARLALIGPNELP